MKLCLLSYYGSKLSIIKHYPPPLYDTIIEPFAGGASYSLAYPNRQVILVEKNERVARALRWIINAGADGVRKLPLLAPDQSVDDLQIHEDAKTVIGFWVNNAVSSPCKRLSKWGRDRGESVSFWSNPCRERLALTADCVRHWQVISGSYVDSPNIEATWFIDPPYETAGVHYPCGSKDIDYNRLGDWCRNRRGQVIVCENVCATWLPFSPLGVGRTAQTGRPPKQEAMFYRIYEGG